MKKIVSFALALLLVVAMVPMAVFAETTTETDIVDVTGKTTITLGDVTYTVVDGEEDIVAADGNYYLSKDITITAPLLADASFTGNFNGGGNVVTLADGVQGMFAQSIGGGALLANFTIKGSITRNAGYGGSLTAIGYVSGGTYYGITNEVNITATDRSQVGGLVGTIANTATDDVTFINCVNKGTIQASSYAGGIFGSGLANQNGVTITFEGCKNYGAISGGDVLGGIIGGTNKSGEKTNITVKITDSHNYAEINGTKTSVGGIFGGVYQSRFINATTKDSKVTVTITDCTNNNKVTGAGHGVGGILGYLQKPVSCDITITGCVNNGNVHSDSDFTGGIFGGCNNTNAVETDGIVVSFKVNNCINTASVSSGTESMSQTVYATGGIGGSVYSSNNSVVNITSCVNLGDVSVYSQPASGIYGLGGRHSNATVTLENCYNAGSITTNSTNHTPAEFAIIDLLNTTHSSTFSLKNCYSIGSNNPYNTREGGVITKDIDTDTVKTEIALDDFVAKANAALDLKYCPCFYVSGDKVVYSAAHNYGETTLSTECSVCGDKASYAGYVQTKVAGETTLVRFVMVVSDEELENATYTDFTMIVTVNGKTYTQKASELDSYDSVTAAGDTFTAADGHVLFGVVVDLGANAFESASVVITPGDVILYSGSI